MQELPRDPAPTTPTKTPKEAFSLMWKNRMLLWQLRREGAGAEQAEESLKAHFQSEGIPQDKIQTLKVLLSTWRKASKDSEAIHTVSRYLIGAVGLLDLVLLPLLVSLGTPDVTTGISWLALALCLPCTVGFLFASFLKKAHGITWYGKIHDLVGSLALGAALISITALIWHVWILAGVLFLVTSVVIGAGSLYYVAGVIMGKYFFQRGIDD